MHETCIGFGPWGRPYVYQVWRAPRAAIVRSFADRFVKQRPKQQRARDGLRERR